MIAALARKVAGLIIEGVVRDIEALPPRREIPRQNTGKRAAKTRRGL